MSLSIKLIERTAVFLFHSTGVFCCYVLFLCSTPLFWIILCLRQVVSICRPLFPLTISANCCSSRWFCLQYFTGCSYNSLFLMYIPCRLHILSSTGFVLCCCIFRYIFIFHIYECTCRLHTWWKVCFLPLSQSVIASRSQNSLLVSILMTTCHLAYYGQGFNYWQNQVIQCKNAFVHIVY